MDLFAMRHLFVLILTLILLISPVWAQNEDTDNFVVTDVPADVTADSAAQARDQAITQAQHTAFAQLLDRMGADPSVGAKLSNDDLATLVQSFEVQNERTSSVRYIGTFTVQFRPMAVRNLVGTHVASAVTPRSKPIIVLPVVTTSGHHLLWEESTKWRAAWDNAAHNSALVPVIMPAGDLDDIAILSTEEAVNGKTPSMRALISKYQAGGAVVATWNQPDANAPAQDIKVDIQHYNAEGNATALSHITVAAMTDGTANDPFAQGVKQSRTQIDRDWRQEYKNGPKTLGAPATSLELSTPADMVAAPIGPTITLPVTVPILSLTEWAQIRGRLNNNVAIRRVDVIAMARGATSIEIVFTGTLDDLRASLAQEGLSLSQNMTNGGWLLRPAMPGDTL